MEIEESLPARGAWIEIFPTRLFAFLLISRSPQGERGLKYHRTPLRWPTAASLPARGAWIEIGKFESEDQEMEVAPRKGSVD